MRRAQNLCARKSGLDGRDHPEGVALGRMRAEVDAAHVAPAARRAEGEEGADDAAERHVLVDLAQPQRGRLLGEDAVRKGDLPPDS